MRKMIEYQLNSTGEAINKIDNFGVNPTVKERIGWAAGTIDAGTWEAGDAFKLSQTSIPTAAVVLTAIPNVTCAKSKVKYTNIIQVENTAWIPMLEVTTTNVNTYLVCIKGGTNTSSYTVVDAPVIRYFIK